MDFTIKNLKDNPLNISRRIGYLMLGAQGSNEYNLVRKITGNNFPRFHVYLKQRGDYFEFNLHLDQKAPIYKGSHAHSGEYEGPVVENEADRIKEKLENRN
jgi:hypothetical protein